MSEKGLEKGILKIWDSKLNGERKLENEKIIYFNWNTKLENPSTPPYFVIRYEKHRMYYLLSENGISLYRTWSRDSIKMAAYRKVSMIIKEWKIESNIDKNDFLNVKCSDILVSIELGGPYLVSVIYGWAWYIVSAPFLF